MKNLFPVLVIALAVPAAAFAGGNFDAEAFRRNEEPGWCALPVPFPFSLNCGSPRAGMWDEVRVALQPGMDRAAVLELLGPPSADYGDVLHYSMGSSPFGIDEDYLTVTFDEDGRLVGTGMTRG